MSSEMDFSTAQIQTALLSLIAFIISVTVHEFGHAWMADKLGDDTPRSQGRLTLAPQAHIDLFGTILIPLLAALAPGGFPMLAWGKPVMTMPSKNTRGLSARTANLLISLMGPMMNLVLSTVFAAGLLAAGRAGVLTPKIATTVIQFLVVLNLRLMFFNLLPLPPLDGGAIVAVLLPQRLQFIAHFLRRYGMILLFILLVTGALEIVMGPADRVTGVLVAALVRSLNL
jgi:Zn-dependent protease